MMMDEGHALVIGSAGIDIKGRPWQELEWGTPNLGRVRNSVGGVARNIAENLARLEVPTVLLTAVGKDSHGKRVLKACERVGINCEHVLQVPKSRTGTFMALLKQDGQLHVAISDFEIIAHVTPEYLYEHESLFEDAIVIVIDATLDDETLETVFVLAEKYNVHVAADPTTPVLATKLIPFIPQLHLVVPNASETAAMRGEGEKVYTREDATQAARDFVAQGAGIAVVTLGGEGLAYAHSGGGGFLRAINTKIIDSTGAGDAFSGAAIFGLLNDVPVDEAMRLGITAASLTLESRHTVLPGISQELLYDKLVV
ncbi:MAG: carbohydrate kinase family protein [Aggregatilineales bacterium]